MGVRRTERGLSQTLEAALLLPVLLGLLLALIQLGIYWHSRNAAIAAAQLTAELSRGHQAGSEAGPGYRIAERAGLTGAEITVRHSPGFVQVTVSGTAPMLAPLGGLDAISETAVMPRERITSP